MRLNNVMLTGLPRSGTTLVCHLLNKLPNVVALAEPMPVGKFGKLRTREAVLKVIGKFGERQSAYNLKRGLAVSKHLDGSITDNSFPDERGRDGLRHSRFRHGEVRFAKTLRPDFELIIKHPVAFTALLPHLAGRFPTYAVIRNPLSVLASWNSTSVPVNDGHAPAAEQLDSDLKGKLSILQNRFDRQLLLLSWHFGQYQRHLASDHIIRYEEIIETRGAALAAISPSANRLNESLETRNGSEIYDWNAITPLAERLLASDGPHWKFYSRDDVRDLLP